MNDRLNQLSLFVRTVETGSFSKAAREFGLSQPSVSRAIASLEARLGVTLLQRTTRRLTTTDVGQALALSAREALAAIDDAENAARGADRLSGVLRVSLPTAYGVRQIIPRLPGFLALQPGLEIELMMSDRYDDLVAEGADLALRLGNQPDSAFLTRKLASAARIIVASPEYLQAPRRSRRYRRTRRSRLPRRPRRRRARGLDVPTRRKAGRCVDRRASSHRLRRGRRRLRRRGARNRHGLHLDVRTGVAGRPACAEFSRTTRLSRSTPMSCFRRGGSLRGKRARSAITSLRSSTQRTEVAAVSRQRSGTHARTRPVATRQGPG